ncbi:uncharacterized protein METZ01_LOCUS250185 [marine metagenome]|uniref:Uncharacterized protein n=1 Tax=marine metagenome TaxID=408172 RepID=A0A382IFB4_9ZZZZ
MITISSNALLGIEAMTVILGYSIPPPAERSPSTAVKCL